MNPTSTDILRWRNMIKQGKSQELDNELREFWLDTLHAENDAPIRVAVSNIPTHCPTCKGEYKHFAHPRTGAIMTSTCECKFRYVDAGNGNTMIIQEPPSSHV